MTDQRSQVEVMADGLAAIADVLAVLRDDRSAATATERHTVWRARDVMSRVLARLTRERDDASR